MGEAFAYLLDGDSWSGSNGLGQQLVQQVLLTVVSLAVATVLSLPVALWLGHIGKGGAIAINISNIGRAIPVFAVLVLLSVGPVGTDVLGPFGRAGAATLISLVLFALPPIITNAYVGVRGVDPEIVEAARGMGMAERRIFTRVEWPLALPLVLTGLRLALVQVWATATIAALVAGPGLGNTITNGFANSRIDQVTAGAILVAVVALLLEGAAFAAERLVDPMRASRRADRHSQRTPSVPTVEPIV